MVVVAGAGGWVVDPDDGLALPIYVCQSCLVHLWSVASAQHMSAGRGARVGTGKGRGRQNSRIVITDLDTLSQRQNDLAAGALPELGRGTNIRLGAAVDGVAAAAGAAAGEGLAAGGGADDRDRRGCGRGGLGWVRGGSVRGLGGRDVGGVGPRAGRWDDAALVVGGLGGADEVAALGGALGCGGREGREGEDAECQLHVWLVGGVVGWKE